jgi:hypothetical protein
VSRGTSGFTEKLAQNEREITMNNQWENTVNFDSEIIEIWLPNSSLGIRLETPLLSAQMVQIFSILARASGGRMRSLKCCQYLLKILKI